MEATPGLEGIVVADTHLSRVEGDVGRLSYRGRPVEAVAGTAPFEALCHLLWVGEMPSDGELERLRSRLGQARMAAFCRLSELGDALDLPDGMDALRAALAHLSCSRDAWPGEAVELTGAVAVFAAAWARTRRGERPVAPDASAGHAADYLSMVHDQPTPAACAYAMDAYLGAVIDHGMNASTFAARVVVSTESDAVSAVVAAVGALKGRLHGGAPGPVLDMLDAVGEPSAAAHFLGAELDAGRRIMGMGHRVYRVRDPRAAVLEAGLLRLEESGAAAGRLELARAVELAAERLLRERKPDRPLRANVEFYTATLLEALDLPRGLFTPTFATSRVAGWCAHIEEQRRTGKLIRPKANYVGLTRATPRR